MLLKSETVPGSNRSSREPIISWVNLYNDLLCWNLRFCFNVKSVHCFGILTDSNVHLALKRLVFASTVCFRIGILILLPAVPSGAAVASDGFCMIDCNLGRIMLRHRLTPGRRLCISHSQCVICPGTTHDCTPTSSLAMTEGITLLIKVTLLYLM